MKKDYLQIFVKKNLLISCIVFFTLNIFLTNGYSQILPASRMGDWSNAGVQGGIPQYPEGVNVHDYGATGDGTTDDTDAILAAVEACSEEQAVFFPAGSYLTTGTIVLSKSIVLRGAGPDLTHIIQNHRGSAVNITTGGDWAGVEDLHVHTRWPDFNAYGGLKIYLFDVQNSWVRNIETSGYSGATVEIRSSSYCEVRDSYFHLSREDTETVATFSASGTTIAGNGLAAEGDEEGCYFNLIENNIYDWFRHAMIMGCLSTNNVWAYNFAWNNWSTAGGGVSSTTDFEIHHIPYNHPDAPSQNSSFTLIEGNLYEQSDEQNANHHDNTFFRNRVNNGGIKLNDASIAVGNELVEKKHPGEWLNNIVTPPGANRIVHGNYEVFNNRGLSWDPAIPDQNILNSYYLASKPAFFGDLDWPCYGGDLMPGNTRRNPAEIRYWSMLFPEVSPSNLQGDLQGNDIVLTWDNNSTNTVDFIICRSTDNNNFERIGETSQATYTDNIETTGEYYYYVRARNHLGGQNYYGEVNGIDLGGESNPSNVISVVDGTVSLEQNIITDNTLSVFPNPAKDVLYFKFPDDRAQNISVYNSSGQLIMEKKYRDNSVNISALKKGCYFLVIKGNKKHYKTRFIIE